MTGFKQFIHPRLLISSMHLLPYLTILFDWGDTVMIDDPASQVPMVEWLTVETV